MGGRAGKGSAKWGFVGGLVRDGGGRLCEVGGAGAAWRFEIIPIHFYDLGVLGKNWSNAVVRYFSVQLGMPSLVMIQEGSGSTFKFTAHKPKCTDVQRTTVFSESQPMTSK